MRRFTSPSTLLAILGALVIVLAGSVGVHQLLGAQAAPANVQICPVNTCVQITGSPTSPVVYPGAGSVKLPITLTNATTDTIYITSVTIAFNNTWQPGCAASEFQLQPSSADHAAGASAAVSGMTTTISFSPGLGILGGQSDTDSALLSLPDSGNQDGCEKQGLAFSYTANAQYTVPTTTSLAVATNSSSDTATLTANIAADIVPATAGRAPGSADGSVQFLQCTPSSSSPSGYSCTPAGAGTWTGSGVATLSIPASSVGTFNYEAVFTPNSGSTDFTGSTSQILTTTLSGCVTAQTTAAATIITGTYSGNYTVSSGTSLWLNNGTITGNLTVTGTGEFAATGGTVDGNVQSTGGAVAMSGTTVLGNVQTQNGGLSLGPTTVVKGNVQAQGGGPFCSQGTSPTQGQVQVRGNLQAQSLTSTITASVCSTTVGNNLQWQSNASPAQIGSCGSNTVLGNLQVQNNSGQVTIGAAGGGNVTNGNTQVQNNTGGGTLTGNKSGGNCLLSGDKPGIVGTGNTTTGANNQCDTGSAGA